MTVASEQQVRGRVREAGLDANKGQLVASRSGLSAIDKSCWETNSAAVACTASPSFDCVDAPCNQLPCLEESTCPFLCPTMCSRPSPRKLLPEQEQNASGGPLYASSLIILACLQAIGRGNSSAWSWRQRSFEKFVAGIFEAITRFLALVDLTAMASATAESFTKVSSQTTAAIDFRIIASVAYQSCLMAIVIVLLASTVAVAQSSIRRIIKVRQEALQARKEKQQALSLRQIPVVFNNVYF